MRELGKIVDELLARLARRETPLYDERENGEGDGTGVGEDDRPAPSPMLSAGASAHASKGRKSRSPEAPAVGAAREEVSPRGNGDRGRHHETMP